MALYTQLALCVLHKWHCMHNWHCVNCTNGIVCINGIVWFNSIRGVAQMALYTQLALCVLHKWHCMHNWHCITCINCIAFSNSMAWVWSTDDHQKINNMIIRSSDESQKINNKLSDSQSPLFVCLFSDNVQIIIKWSTVCLFVDLSVRCKIINRWSSNDQHMITKT